jgi:hypothetical protein
MKRTPKKTMTDYGWHSMPDADYFALPHLSNSRLKLLDNSAAHLKADLDREKEIKAGKRDPDEPTPAMIFGQAYHAYMLGPGKIAIIPDDINRRTKAGREQWQQFCDESAGKAIVSADDMEKIKAMHNALHEHPKASKLLRLKDALREAAGLFKHPVFGFDCKIKTDIICLKNRWIIDLKSAISAKPDVFNKAIYNFKYHWQRNMYCDGARAIAGGGKPFEFFIIAQEKTEPYAPAVFEIGAAWQQIAQAETEPLFALYKNCLETDLWPGYNTSIIISEPPAWAAKISNLYM